MAGNADQLRKAGFKVDPKLDDVIEGLSDQEVETLKSAVDTLKSVKQKLDAAQTDRPWKELFVPF
jgi:hypothetical protein